MHSPPQAYEFELTLFGNGYGECVLLHMCDNKWIIVDSCINPNTRRIAPVEYLESIGVNVSEQVEMFIVSHWHEDHIKGASLICQTCENAKIVLSQAMAQREFMRFINIVNQRPIYSYAGRSSDEIKKVLDTVMQRKKSGEYECKWASTDRPLYSREIGYNGTEVSVVALSPSDHAITTSAIEIAKLVPKVNSKVRVSSNMNPNLFAVVLWLSLGNIQILLGSDLEERAHPRGAWSIIANNINRPKGLADVFKVPHHGSQNAHCNDVYDNMLADQHISVLTPFKHGKVSLPEATDVERLKKGKSSNIYMACKATTRNIKHDVVVEKILKESTKSRKTLNSFGSITLRKDMSGKPDGWQIFQNGHAHML